MPTALTQMAAIIVLASMALKEMGSVA